MSFKKLLPVFFRLDELLLTSRRMSDVENGPTIVGDQWSDPELMEYLGARLIKEFGNNFEEYRCEDPPRMVLDKLEQRGYRVVSMTGVGQTCIWTLHKEANQNQ